MLLKRAGISALSRNIDIMPPTPPPFEIHPGNFSLNVSGVAGFFGGDEAISAIQTIHHYEYRKWTGWYNSPGSWNVGKKFGKLAKSRFWDGLFPGPDEEPAKFFELDGKQGPKYVASRSGTILEHTGHLAYLIMQKSKEELGYQVTGDRTTKQNKVTIVKMQPCVFERGDKKENKPPARNIPPLRGHHTSLVAILPIAVSFTTCGLCGWTHDWFCFSMILLGIVSSGIFSLVIGSARLKLQGVNSAHTAPPGDGILMDGDDIVLLLGREEDVATITRGKFVLEYDPWVRWRRREEKRKRSVPGDGTKPQSDHTSDTEKGQVAGQVDGASNTYPMSREPVTDEYNAIGLCSILLVIQLLAQLLLIPQGTLFGQIMFLSSFAASWGYNLYLSSIDKEYIQERLILDELNLEKKHMQTYVFGTRTTAAAFACLMLQPPGFEPEHIIHNFMPNNTPVWIAWREKVLEVMRKRDGSRDICHNLLKMNSDEETFEPADRELLDQLLEDARIAYDQAMDVQEWLMDDENNGNDSIQT
ncbi:hypothetical protein BDR04DRAFT_1055635 [Suillus decipiens]|nr:hypothetical protein BDR04DRAFT_1055635 [Suillus decipiens]